MPKMLTEAQVAGYHRDGFALPLTAFGPDTARRYRADLEAFEARIGTRLFGIAGKGRIAAGFDADLTVVDLKRRQTITDSWVASRPGWTPYNGVAVTGWPIGTFVRGRKVMWEGELTAPSQGEPMAFHESLPH